MKKPRITRESVFALIAQIGQTEPIKTHGEEADHRMGEEEYRNLSRIQYQFERKKIDIGMALQDIEGYVTREVEAHQIFGRDTHNLIMLRSVVKDTVDRCPWIEKRGR
jgi:hypothetical protein